MHKNRKNYSYYQNQTGYLIRIHHSWPSLNWGWWAGSWLFSLDSLCRIFPSTWLVTWARLRVTHGLSSPALIIHVRGNALHVWLDILCPFPLEFGKFFPLCIGVGTRYFVDHCSVKLFKTVARPDCGKYNTTLRTLVPIV